jgi:hypothetical protein
MGADVDMGVLEVLLMPSCSESCSESCVWDWVFGLYIGGGSV